MDKFNWLFGVDRFTLYKTWTHQSSVVYRFTTWTNMTAYLSSYILPTKENVIFLRVQKPSFSSSYDALKAAGLELDPDARTGLANTLAGMLGQKLAFWETTAGSDIKTFCRDHLDHIAIAMEEIGHLRLFLIVWEPDHEKKATLEGLKEFAIENFKAQLTQAEWEQAMRASFKAVAKASLLAGFESD
ncbi:uncharacterized protein F5Z01DRAFT_691544 [Emericellopsis atlantica]|uniref:Uncharacterized protein n=1 Tax=Emericellopsis atlantica TaxID=2614577 RepID=A0A9P7ZHE0_9HYPO|nr:uncharacterized protein F5Z01DRAFT_691544 [Emericellopsis atlantica]KAG9251966.1 hypothetical protein F5Z01DRAFT_691544 [Emericellopsis atlantica]